MGRVVTASVRMASFGDGDAVFKLMRIHKLEVVRYPTPPRDSTQSRFGPQSTSILSPKVSDLETAIRRLDRDEWPYVWLHTSEPLKDEFPNNMLEVMGGRGEFAITLYKDGDEICYVDDSRRNQGDYIEIWESDQGRDVIPWGLCNDLATVLDIVGYFNGHSALSPKYTWKTN